MDVKLILDFLDKVGSQLSTTGKVVFELYTRQVYTTGVVSLCTAGIEFIGAVLTIVGVIAAAKIVHRQGFDESQRTAHQDMVFFMAFMASILLTLATALLLSMAIGDSQVGILRVMNPQYYAVQQSLDMLKSTVGK